MPIVTKHISGLGANPLDELIKAGGQIAQNVMSGQVDVGQLLRDPIGASIRRISFHTAYTAPVTMTGAELMAAMGGPPNPKSAARIIGGKLKPTVTLDTIAGRYEYAPYGASLPTEWKGNRERLMWLGGAAVVGVLGLTFALGRLSKRTK